MYSLNFSDHSVKVGGEYNYMPYVSESAGNGAESGTYTFARDQYFNPNDPASVAALTGAATFSASTPPEHDSHPSHYYVGVRAGRLARAANVTLNLGLRYERLYGPANEDLDPNDFPVTLPVHRRQRARRKEQLRPAHRRRLGRRRQRQHGRPRRLRSLLRPHPHARQPQRVQQLQAVLDQHHQPVVPRSLPRPEPRRFIVRRRRPTSPWSPTTTSTVFEPVDGRRFAAADREYALHVDAVNNRRTGDYKTLDINARDPAALARCRRSRVDRSVRPAARIRRATLKFDKRFSHRHQFMVTYTYTDSATTRRWPLSRSVQLSLDWGPSNGERRHAVVASGSVLLPFDITLGAVWTDRSQLPWNATAGRDSMATASIPIWCPARRAIGSRDLDLAAVNAWRATMRRLPRARSIVAHQPGRPAGQQSDPVRRASKIDLMAQMFNLFNTDNLQAQCGGGRVTNACRTRSAVSSRRGRRQAELAVRLIW